ncbi:MAG: ABC transporter substrate-binding protein, partial [Nitrososphaerota archaeon]
MYKSFHGVGKIVAIVSIIIALIIGLIAGYFVSLSLAPPSLSTVTVAQATVTTTSVKTITVTSTVGVAPERIVIGVTDKVSDIDPANAYDFYTWEVLTNIMGGLMRYTPGTTELEPGLAISYTVSPDGKEYTFKLRPNLYFADGKKVTAHDV